MAERTLEEQHAVEREYYMRKTNKAPNGKLVSTMKKEFEEFDADYQKKLDAFSKKHRGRNAEDEAVKVQPIATAVTFGIIDKVIQDPPLTEKTAQKPLAPQGGASGASSSSATPTADTDLSSTKSGNTSAPTTGNTDASSSGAVNDVSGGVDTKGT